MILSGFNDYNHTITYFSEYNSSMNKNFIKISE